MFGATTLQSQTDHIDTSRVAQIPGQSSLEET